MGRDLFRGSCAAPGSVAERRVGGLTIGQRHGGRVRWMLIVFGGAEGAWNFDRGGRRRCFACGDDAGSSFLLSQSAKPRVTFDWSRAFACLAMIAIIGCLKSRQ